MTANVVAFAAFFLIPIPFVGLASFLGILLFPFQPRDIRDKTSTKILLFVFVISFYTLAINHVLQISLPYEELKRFFVPLAAFGNFFLLRTLVPKIGNFESFLSRAKVLVFFALGGFTLATAVWWKLPLGYESYSWFKYIGGGALFALIFQTLGFVKIEWRRIVFFGAGVMLSILSILQNAKGLGVLTILCTLLFSLNSSKNTPNEKKGFGIKGYLLPLSGVFALFFGSVSGIFGSYIQSHLGQYGNNFLEASFNARPEFSLSLFILKKVTFFGLGTPSGPQFYLLEGYKFRNMDYGLQLNFSHRVLGDGINLHSWAFDEILRFGVVGMIICLSYVVILIQTLRSPILLREFPGMYFIVLSCLYSFFFSPFDWFTSIGIGISLYAYWLTRQFRERDVECIT